MPKVITKTGKSYSNNFVSTSSTYKVPSIVQSEESKMPHADEKPMTVGDHPQCDPAKTRIIHVGMGASGMLAAHKAKRFLKNYELVCYEKNSNPGGTWWEYVR